MRTIRFRAWDEQNKIMHNDFQFIKSGDECYDWIIFTSDKQTLQDSTHPFENPYFGQQLKIMEYTGLKDKNGVKIYEGDIVEAWSAGSKGIFQVKWRQEGSPCWLLYPNFQERQHWSIHATEHKVGKQFISVDGKITTTDLDGFYDDGLTVIGNIHQNPELL